MGISMLMPLGISIGLVAFGIWKILSFIDKQKQRDSQRNAAMQAEIIAMQQKQLGRQSPPNVASPPLPPLPAAQGIPKLAPQLSKIDHILLQHPEYRVILNRVRNSPEIAADEEISRLQAMIEYIKNQGS